MIVGPPLDGCEGYCQPDLMPAHGIRRRWLFHGRPRSVEWRAGGVVKDWSTFTEHQTPEAMHALLAEAAGRGVVRPSSYGDLFHQTAWQPPTRAAVRKLFPGGTIPGAWIGTIGGPTMRTREPLRLYDIRSAYLWSLAQGLPDPATFRQVRRVVGPGLYWAPSPAHPMLPYPWNRPGWWPATEDELLAMPIAVRDVRHGITFTPDSWPVAKWVEGIGAWTCHKAVARAYWGRWIAAGAPVAETLGPDGDVRTSRDLPDARRNPVWAALITSRLRLRLWQQVNQGQFGGVLRVHTDSVVTTQLLPTGEKVGDWVLKDEWPRGGIVRREGVAPLC